MILFALQYGGSEAHAAVFKHQRGDWRTATALRDTLISLRRAINNGWCASMTDTSCRKTSLDFSNLLCT